MIIEREYDYVWELNGTLEAENVRGGCVKLIKVNLGPFNQENVM